MYLIAEIGFNHAGDMNVAKALIRGAAEAGADAVKFQTYRAEDLALPSSPHFAAIACGTMNLEQHLELKAEADAVGVDFLSTPFAPWAVDLLEEVGVGAYKIASMDCANHHLLGRVARTGKPIYLSTGMARLEEIAESLDFLATAGAGPVTLLHCVSKYPAAMDELQLETVPLLRRIFGLPTGYSDHHPGIEACFAAAALGAAVVETHFTLDASRPDGDHPHSADPKALATLVSRVRTLNTMRGRPMDILRRPDRTLADAYRRGVYAARDLAPGERLHEADLLLCRPASAFSPNDLPRLLGHPLRQAVPALHPLTAADLHEMPA